MNYYARTSKDDPTYIPPRGSRLEISPEPLRPFIIASHPSHGCVVLLYNAPLPNGEISKEPSIWHVDRTNTYHFLADTFQQYVGRNYYSHLPPVNPPLLSRRAGTSGCPCST
jgi:hypothetical protein